MVRQAKETGQPGALDKSPTRRTTQTVNPCRVSLTSSPFLDPSGMFVFLTMAPPEWVGFWVAKRNFSDEQIAFALRQAWSGTSVAEVIRRLGISDADLLPMEEAVCWAWRCRVATATDLGGGEPEAQAAGCRPQPRQEDTAGRALKKILTPRGSSVFWCGRYRWRIGLPSVAHRKV